MWWWDLVWHFVLACLVAAWVVSIVFAGRIEAARQERRRSDSSG
jgi:hypothetical protein